jgi:hypothetical protein
VLLAKFPGVEKVVEYVEKKAGFCASAATNTTSLAVVEGTYLRRYTGVLP